MALIEDLSKPQIQKFIRDHENDDPYQVTLRFKEVGGVPSKYLAEQIAARKKAKGKLPGWYSVNGIVYPSPLSVEQASSEITAAFKSQILSGRHIIDLTGGLGVDSAGFASLALKVDYIEKDPFIAECARHNLSILGYSNVIFFNSDAPSFLRKFKGKADGIYIDPLRRHQNNRVFLFEDSEPDVILLQDKMIEKASDILIKASPMIDIKSGLKKLKHVVKVYVVAVRNEVKEILFLLNSGRTQDLRIEAVNFKSENDEIFNFYPEEELESSVAFDKPLNFLYEPNAAILKAGAFRLFANRFNLKKLHPNSHLYTSSILNLDVPGRRFRIKKFEPFKGGKQFKGLNKANISTRNFRITTKDLRNRLGLKEGGSEFLYFTTDINENPIVIFTEKADK